MTEHERTSATQRPLVYHECKHTNYLCFFYIYSRCDTLTNVIVRSEAWLYCDGCVLVEYFLKWCVKMFVLLFSQDVSAKPWANKCANRIPCFRKCSHFTFNPAILVCEGIALLQSVDVDLVITI